MAEYHAIHLHCALKEEKQPQQNHLILCSCVSVVCDLFFFQAMQRKHKWHSVPAEEPDARHDLKSDPETPGFYLTHMGLRRCWFHPTDEIRDPKQPLCSARIFLSTGKAENTSLAKISLLTDCCLLEAGLHKQLCSLGNHPAGNPPMGRAVFFGRSEEGLLLWAKARRLYTEIYIPIKRPRHRVIP